MKFCVFLAVWPPTQGVEAPFAFETPTAVGRGYIRLLKDKEDAWKAFTLFTMLTDLKGHEEVDCTCDTDASPIPLCEILTERKREIETSPHVLISEPLGYFGEHI